MAVDTHGADGKPWVGFDLDGTLATYDHWRGIAHIGDPVKPMCDLIKKLHGDGKDVKIVTARVAPREDGSHLLARAFIARWCRDNLGFVPPITNEKDALMETLYDDRVHAVEPNKGKVLNMAKFKVGDKVKVHHGTKDGKVLSVKEGMRGPIYDVQLGTLHGVPYVHLFEEKELVAANAARSMNSIVANALNAVARNASGLDGLIADLDSGKYDSVNWMPKVIGPGTLYPDGMKFPTGLGYDDEEKVRAAWKSGKYASVVLYKGGAKRGEIPVNADTSTVREKAVNAKFKPNDLVEWRDARGRHNSAFYVRDNGDRITVSIEPDGQGGGLEIPKAWITNSLARNAAGYVDASSVIIYPGDAVVFKAQYSSHKDDDEWLERNGDTVREVRGNEVKIGPSANDWAKKSDLMVWHNARARNAVAKNAYGVESKYYSGPFYPHLSDDGSIVEFRTEEEARKYIADQERRDRMRSSSVQSYRVVRLNAIGQDKRDEASVETWTSLFENNYLKFQLPRMTDKERARKIGEKLIKYVEDALGSEGGRAQLKKMGWTVQKMRDALEKGLAAKNAVRNSDKMHDIDAHGKKLVKGDWVRFLRDLPDVKKGECAVVKYALPEGLIFSTLAGAREVSWDASVVEKMPPIPRSLSEVEAWKKGPRATARNSVSGDADAQKAAEKISDAVRIVKAALEYAKSAKNPGAKRNVGTISDSLEKLNIALYGVRADNAACNAVVRKALNAARARNASADAEFEKLKKMAKDQAEAWIKDNLQSLIDKYGHPEVVKLAKRVSSIKRKPIKKGRFAGKSGDMTYYVDYTADSWYAQKYGKDGTNVTEIQVTGPYEKDPDGKERRHILYFYRSGAESIPAQNPQVASLVKKIMAGSNAIKAGDPEYAWNAARSRNAVVANALKARNDKWIDDFHVIETKGTPDKGLVDALKKKASAWKVAKRNFSDAAAASAHDKAEAEAMAVAKRLGARWVQQGAVLRVVMPNSTALNWNYKNQYKFFCVDPSLKAPCILSGWDYREDAKDDAAELKELGIPHKIVSRRFLEQQGIDPNVESSWKKNRR